jgi:hypothetical protein
LRAAFYLQNVETSWIKQETIPASNLKEIMRAFKDSMDWTYTVAWIDCLANGSTLGRSLLYRGKHAVVSDLKNAYGKKPFSCKSKPRRKIGIDCPSWLFNRPMVRAFNSLYYWQGRLGPSCQLVSWEKFFYPLDAIEDWNRLYGKHGFIQFQCVIPLEKSYEGLSELLEAISEKGQASFLAVLKLFGTQHFPFSFPMEGYTLALDFPASLQAFELANRLDQIALKYGGRFYLTKDARMTKETFDAGEPRSWEMRKYRDKIGASEKFVSEQSKRLEL